MEDIRQICGLIFQLFTALRTEKHSGDVVIRVNFNQGGIRNWKAFKEEKLDT